MLNVSNIPATPCRPIAIRQTQA